LTAGGRYSKDWRYITSHNHNATTCLSLGVAFTTEDACTRDQATNFDGISYTLSLQYKPAQNVMLYAKIDRSYRAGGLQQTGGGTSPAVANAAFTPFRPEFINNYEGGLKADWLDRHLQTNITYFHSRTTDAIRQVSSPVAGTTQVVGVGQNAASVLIDGVEWQVTAYPVERLELSTTGAWLDARFGKYITPTGVDLTYLPVLGAPRWQYSLSAAYTVPFDNGTVRSQIDWSWQGRMLTAEPGAFSGAHGLLNGRIGAHFDSIGIEVALYIKNITDRRYLVNPQDLRAALGIGLSSFYNPPRTYGISVAKDF